MGSLQKAHDELFGRRLREMLTEGSQDNKDLFFNMLGNNNRRRRKHTSHSFSNTGNRNYHNSFNSNGTNQDHFFLQGPPKAKQFGAEVVRPTGGAINVRR